MKTTKPHTKRVSLEQLPDKHPYTVPDGYFDKLPAIIQARVQETSTTAPQWIPGGYLRLAAAMLIVVVVAGYLTLQYQNHSPNNLAHIEAMLDEVPSEELVAYLETTDISTDELLEMVNFEGETLDDFTYQLDDISDEELDYLLEDFEYENFNDI